MALYLSPMTWGEYKNMVNSPNHKHLFTDSIPEFKFKLKIYDIYGYALLLKKDKKDYPDDALLKDIYDDKVDPISDESPVKDSTLDRVLLTLYYHYNFDISSFRRAYQEQKDIVGLLRQVMTKEYSRFKSKKNYIEQAAFPRFLHLNPELKMPVPKLTRLMDHISLPAAVSPPINELRVIKADAENLSIGYIVIDQDDKVHDVIAINKTFLDTQPYGNRMLFLHRFKDYEPVPQLIAYNFQQILDNAKILETPNNVVVKPLGYDYLDSNWLQYNKNSAFSCYVSKNHNELYTKFKKDRVIGAYLKTLSGKILNKTDLKPTASRETVNIWRSIVDKFDAQAVSFQDYKQARRVPVWKSEKDRF